jgi:YgiT-type zinc finger domain-containing protein
MECLCCRGTLVRERASYCVTCMGTHLMIDDLPAWACEPCGEPLFDENTVEALKTHHGPEAAQEPPHDDPCRQGSCRKVDGPQASAFSNYPDGPA